MLWVNGIAIGKDTNGKFTFYEITEDGNLLLSGDNWGRKFNYPNRICKINDKEKSYLIAEQLNNLENNL